MTTLQELMKEIKNFKPIPAVVNQLLTVVDHPDSSMEDIANLIQYDPAITASVLKTCNCAFFGLKHPAESIKDAVNILGTDQIIELVLLKSGAKALCGSQKGYGLERGDMWRYSVSSAMIAKMWKFSPKMIQIIRHHHLSDETMIKDKEIATHRLMFQLFNS